MEVDTGAAVSIISNSSCNELLPRLKLHVHVQPCKLILKTYTNEQMQIVGQLNAYVQ